MDKTFIPSQVEEEIYSFWEKNGYFEAKIDKNKKQFCIILPPPNANADLHLGHAMYAYEDVMIRYHKLIGDESLWLPGADHAGFETQYVFEKQLAKQDRSRFDYDRETLYKMIWDFAQANRPRMEKQLRRLGFALDWSRAKFTLDKDIIKIVYKTFKQLFKEGLIYRANRLVNYCTKDGTSFSDLEVKYIEQKDPLYYLKYGPFTIATVRPETKFRDTALAVNPKDKRYKKWLGKKLKIKGLLGDIEMTVIADPEVDPKFGTGIMKVTPAHDMHDFELGKKYNLPVTPIIDFKGRMDFSWFLEKKEIEEKYRERAKNYHGKKILEARRLMVEDLKKDRLLVRIDEDYTHRVGTCYKCGRMIEPLPLEQWYIKVKPLADKAIGLLKTDKIRIIPPRFKKTLIQWLNNFHDWNISRQIVWGIRIPAYKCKKMSNVKCQMSNGWFVSTESPKECCNCGSLEFKQDPDTFDTWFSSAQWPFATLMSTKKGDFDYFYPTSVMETAYDILPWWVARMIMIGLHMTKKVPFNNVFFHGLVRDRKGQKMSKSKDNVMNPLELVDRYGADAVRASLIYGTKEGNDQSLSEEKIIGMRNFANKVWNIGRYIWLNNGGVIASTSMSLRAERSNLSVNSAKQSKNEITSSSSTPRNDVRNAEQILKELKKEFTLEKKKYLKLMDGFKFSQALGEIYEFIWHRFADYYIEELKEELRNGNIKVLKILKEVYFENLKMLHPYMPFLTEAVWKVFNGTESSILSSNLKSQISK